ncbi:Sodium and chloride-dependent glycine transporter [Culex quinquefasciatus]|uniref:Sodium-dependent nutrient amino acid transporter 1 n=1 Tax=Culex quinquefasciatus TaxID=7176 RepID=B0XHW4_CULQU|nr:Sodium and chloride-dependent glycine transporter [Culex quinquefasciatus]|eukprot:XP_001869236.1 Sodium and chloride-dependent glycine transporter [Culex quinquefasciatus]
MAGVVNRSFVGDDSTGVTNNNNNNVTENGSGPPGSVTVGNVEEQPQEEREKWSNGAEFLLSCIAMSVGLGNVWKFPSTAFRNGGGAFVIPYLIVLLIVGRPIYYLEMVMGQFSSRGSVKVYDVSPLMRGIGLGQMIAMSIVISYYAATIAVAIRYFVASFSAELPWATCDPAWTDVNCINSSSSMGKSSFVNSTLPVQTSAELFYTRSVTGEDYLVGDEIGLPDWKLALCLLFIWVCITFMLIKGIQGSGKISYFLALFPYAVMLFFAVYCFNLEGAGNGLLYFITPDWEKLLTVNVWKEAVSQCFFSLSICFGGVIAYSSFNNFSNNIYRDAMIISWTDTFTSLLSGAIVFSIIGHLGVVTGETDYTKVVHPGAGLTFITYPEALAKFEHVPNLFAVLFFFMLFVLGIGSNTGIITSVVTAIRDQFPGLKNWKIVLVISALGFSTGFLFITPASSRVIDYVDYYGVTFVTLTLAVAELACFCWIYGVRRICRDIDFMLGLKTSILWRVCWKYVTPIVIAIILLLTFATGNPPERIATGFHVLGWFIYAAAILPLPILAIRAVLAQPSDLSLWNRIKRAARPLSSWGPENLALKKKYDDFVDDAQRDDGAKSSSIFQRFLFRREKSYSVNL